ncbi:hypothetical protein [Fodinibius sediminis]|uniref:Beta/gamma crystallin 'Greek key' domain-containing protein n=1 Tax=Fodinibius sediminis TaxID=1214077 RepID=A0A521DLL6_9BACT|nr:hypothetical protein [Fodinibius sediminis]SMO72614.1 hypothetical protein SAMN06265218_11122 [Fodinibius sediminis]
MSTNIDKALHAALEGPEIQRLKVYGHHWNVKPADVLRREGTRVRVEGQLDHSVRMWDDDHLFYKFTFKNGKLEEQDLQIKEKGLGQIAGIVANAVGKFVDMPIPPEEISKIGNKLENMAHNEWQYAIQKLALRIGLEGYRRMHSITAYTKPRFGGVSQVFSPGVYEASDFWAVGNDRIASLRVPPRMKVLVCKHRPGVGRPEECKTYTKDRPALDEEVMGVSYLSVEDLDNPGHTLVIDGTEAQRAEYTVRLKEGSGWLRKDAHRGSIQRSDKISDDRTTARGIVGGGKDAYQFTGDLEEVRLSGDEQQVVIKVDGEPVEALH